MIDLDRSSIAPASRSTVDAGGPEGVSA